MRQLFVATIGGAALTACASLPPVTVQYYPTAGSTEVKVLETLTCTPDRTQVVSAYALKPETRYFRAPDRAPNQIELRGVIPPWSDGVAGFTFYGDGRLKSINSTATGRGEEIVNAGVGLITAVAGGGFFSRPHGLTGEPPAPPHPCEGLLGEDGEGVVTIEHTATILHAGLTKREVPLHLNVRDARIRSAFSELPALRLEVSEPQRIAPPAAYTAAPNSQDVVPLRLNHTASAELGLMAGSDSGPSDRLTSTIIVAEAASYEVPLPRAAPFGERTVSLGLEESGAVTALSYGTKTGFAGAVNAGTGVLGLYAADSATAQAAEVKGEADLIAQLQRLARCRADPAGCT